MRPPLLLLVSLLAPADPASAQVTVDLRALDALPNARPPITRPAPAATGAHARPHARSPAVSAATTGTSTASAQGASTAATGSKPAGQASTAATSTATASTAATSTATAGTATAPTAAATSVPDSKLPAGAPPAEPTGAASPNVMADATPAAAQAAAPSGPVAAAVRVMFQPGQGELGGDAAGVIKGLVSAAPAGDTTTFNVVAYAAATPDDPSAARRLSLSRALAVRNALMADGVPSSRIYVRALGGQAGDGPADRADVSVLGGNAAPAAPAKPQ